MRFDDPVFLIADKARQNAKTAGFKILSQVGRHFNQRAGQNIGKYNVIGGVFRYQFGLIAVADAGGDEFFKTVVFGVAAGNDDGFLVNVHGGNLRGFAPKFGSGQRQYSRAGADVENTGVRHVFSVELAECPEAGFGGLVF